MSLANCRQEFGSVTHFATAWRHFPAGAQVLAGGCRGQTRTRFL